MGLLGAVVFGCVASGLTHLALTSGFGFDTKGSAQISGVTGLVITYVAWQQPQMLAFVPGFTSIFS